MNILVLGGTGFFGKHLVWELLHRGHEVTIATRGRTPDDFGDRVRRLIVDRTDARQMEQVAAIEKEHETRYRKLWENIKTQQVFARDSEVTWICGSCGHEVKGKDAPEICPVCHHAQGYFRIKAENY